MEILLSRYTIVFHYTIVDTIFHVTLADEIRFVFVAVNETLNLRSTWLPALFSKKGKEDFERPCRIFTL